MFRTASRIGLLAVALTFAGCSTDNAGSPPAAPGDAGAAPVAGITFDQGFYNLERNSAITWRWMSERGAVSLPNTGVDMRLHIIGDVPVDHFKTPTTFAVALNGETLDEFVATAGVDKAYVVPAAKQGTAAASQLTMTVSNHFVPKDEDAMKSNDTRTLGFSLRVLTWDPK